MDTVYVAEVAPWMFVQLPPVCCCHWYAVAPVTVALSCTVCVSGPVVGVADTAEITGAATLWYVTVAEVVVPPMFVACSL